MLGGGDEHAKEPLGGVLKSRGVGARGRLLEEGVLGGEGGAAPPLAVGGLSAGADPPLVGEPPPGAPPSQATPWGVGDPPLVGEPPPGAPPSQATPLGVGDPPLVGEPRPGAPPSQATPWGAGDPPLVGAGRPHEPLRPSTLPQAPQAWGGVAASAAGRGMPKTRPVAREPKTSMPLGATAPPQNLESDEMVDSMLTKIDYADNGIQHFASRLPDTMQFVALNTNVPHVLAESDYSHRVEELKLGIDFLSKHRGTNVGGPSLKLGTINALLKEMEHVETQAGGEGTGNTGYYGC